MQTKGAYVAEIMKLVAYMENKKDPLIQTFRTHQYSKLKACTVTNFKKSFQNENKSKGIRNVVAQSIKEKWKNKRMLRQFTCITEETSHDGPQLLGGLQVVDNEWPPDMVVSCK